MLRISIRKYHILLLCITINIFHCSNAKAKVFHTDRRKSSAEAYWSLSLKVLPTYHGIMQVTIDQTKEYERSILTMLPQMNFGLIRNYTDKTFAIFSLNIGPSYASVANSGSFGHGFYTSINITIGRELFNIGESFLAIIGGINGVYNNISINPVNSTGFPVQDNAQSNIHFGGNIFLGLYTNLQFDKLNRFIITATVGTGPYGVMFTTMSSGAGNSPWNNPVFTAVSLFGNFTFSHLVKITQKDYFRWFVGVDVPFIYVPTYNNLVQSNSWINYISVTAGLGFTYLI